LKRSFNKVLIFGITIFYLALAVFTQNLLPCVLILINIRYIRLTDNGMFTNGLKNYSNTSEDYLRYNFDIKSFKLFKGIKYAASTYGIIIAANIIINLILLAYKLDLKEQEIVRELSNGSLNQLLYMLPSMLVFAPIVEEFTFRWLLFEKLFKPRVGIFLAALLSSIMFSLVHFNIRSFPIIMIIGFVNCYFIHKKGYWYAVFNHSVFNSVSAIIMIYQKIS
jgi:membrane protease YdiL (CAAX protease family)